MAEMKGLHNFIYEIKKCKSPQEEEARVELELTKIRAAFENPKKLKGYDRKKYMYKLIMIYLLGHKIAVVGFSEALNLVASAKLREKLTGYLYFSIVMLNTADLTSSVIECMRQDVCGRNELVTSIALNCIAIVAGPNILGILQPTIANFLVLSEISTLLKKKAAMCLLKFFRLAPEKFPHKLLGGQLVGVLEATADLGLVGCITSLLQTVAPGNLPDYPGLVDAAITRLHKTVTVTDPAYVYHLVPAPWLTVSLLRLLRLFPASSDPNMQALLQQVLNTICERAAQTAPERVSGQPFRGKLSFYHCNYAALFEVAQLVASYDNLTQAGQKVKANLALQLVGMLEANGPTTKWSVLNALLALGQTRLGTDILEPHRETFRIRFKTEPNATVLQIYKEILDLLDEECLPPPSAELAALHVTPSVMDEQDEHGFFAHEDREGRHSSDED
eukprot:m.227341 g.227341  ORF g.227341 m.227341 type:complete len:447 (+) comp17192_c0_seq1:84-1424(+)